MSAPTTSGKCDRCGSPAPEGADLCGDCLFLEIVGENAHLSDRKARSRSSRRPRSGRSNILTRFILAGFGLCLLLGVFYWLSPWGAFQRATKRDTPSAYQTFLKQHAGSPYASEARERWAELEYKALAPEASNETLREFSETWKGTEAGATAWQKLQDRAEDEWERIKLSEDSEALRGFTHEYLGTGPARRAKLRIKELLPKTEWKKIAGTRSISELEDFRKSFPTAKESNLADQRIDELCSDYDWVRSADRIDLYKRYLELSPATPHRVAIEKRIIDLEVAAIVSGDHGILPPATRTGYASGATAVITIENATSHTLTIRYSGPDSRRVNITSRGTEKVSLSPGRYRVAATVSSPGVTPYAGSENLQGGTYSSQYYIRTTVR